MTQKPLIKCVHPTPRVEGVRAVRIWSYREPHGSGDGRYRLVTFSGMSNGTEKQEIGPWLSDSKSLIALKDRRVLASCRTEEQRKVAAKYHELALKAVRS